MIDSYLMNFIKDRMSERDVHLFRWHPVTIPVKAGIPYWIGAYNEYYYLATRSLDDETLIQGDNHYVRAHDFSNLTVAWLHEFTGSLSIESPTNITIEMIRVIPHL